MVRGFQCAFCGRFLTSLPSQRARYWVGPTTSWVSDPRNRNNVMIERAIRRYLTARLDVELTKADLEKVTKLSFDRNQLTSVKDLEKLTQLTELYLQYNQLTDVKGLEKLNHLKTLELSFNQLTDVKGLEKLTNLTYLSLNSNPDLTKAQIDELQKALPKCENKYNAK